MTAMFFLLTSCSRHVVPNPGPVDPEHLPEVSVNGAVRIIGEPPDYPEKIILCSVSNYSVSTNLPNLTSAAVAVAENVCEQNEVETAGTSSKTLKLSITHAYCEETTTHAKICTRLAVQAGDSINKEFVAYQRLWSLHRSNWALEAAISRAVIQMFEDREISEYLAN
jgi:hypothetical protein